MSMRACAGGLSCASESPAVSSSSDVVPGMGIALLTAVDALGEADRRFGRIGNRQAFFLHQLDQQRFRFGMRDRGLNAHANQPARPIERYPRLAQHAAVD